MQLSIQQTAELLGKTRRQVVYLIQQGQLPARKVGGRWQIERADLKLDDAARQIQCWGGTRTQRNPKTGCK